MAGGGWEAAISKKTGVKYKAGSIEVKINSGIQQERSASASAVQPPQQIMVHCFPLSKQQ